MEATTFAERADWPAADSARVGPRETRQCGRERAREIEIEIERASELGARQQQAESRTNSAELDNEFSTSQAGDPLLPRRTQDDQRLLQRESLFRNRRRRRRRKMPRSKTTLPPDQTTVIRRRQAIKPLILCQSIFLLLFILALAWGPPASSATQRAHQARKQERLPAQGAPAARQASAARSQPRRRLNHRRQTLGSERKRRAGSDHLGLELADRPVVGTRKGFVRGISQRLFTGKNVDAFLGIPYAEPPIGKFRFRHPQPIRPWPGELEASRMPNSCYQINDTFFGPNFLGTSIWNANTHLNEDCLYLNIWSPFGAANCSRTSERPTPVAAAASSARSFDAIGARDRGPKKAVMVWIFGGGFYSGTSSLAIYDGGLLASEEDVVLVSINYRVNSLGFLYFGRPDAPGNAGLFDQLLALQWIHDNIDQFGGDPNRVTIFGESAGAVSISLHMLSPLSRNLFSQAILQSGAATCPWGLMEIGEIVSNGLQLAQALNCPYNKSDLESVMECLLRADPLALVSQEVGQSKTVLNFPFVPVVDGSFLLETPAESMAKLNFKPAPVLLGSNFDEGNSWLAYMPEYSHCPSADKPLETPAGTPPPAQQTTAHPAELPVEPSAEQLVFSSTSDNPFAGNQPVPLVHQDKKRSLAEPASTNGGSNGNGNGNQVSAEPKPCKPNEALSLTRDDFFRLLKDDFLNPYATHPVTKEAIVFEYSNWNNPHDSISNYDALDKIVGDYHFTCHVNEFAQRYAAAGNPVYMYYFRQQSSISPWPKWMGVLHGDEISFVFGEPLNRALNYTPKEIELSRRMMGYWANFAKYGDPNALGENATVAEKERWPEYSGKRLFFELHGDYIRVGRGPRAKQCAFWSSYMPQLLDSFDKHCPAQHRRSGARLAHQALPSTGASRNKRQTFASFATAFAVVILLLAVVVASLVYARRTGKLNLMLTGSATASTSNGAAATANAPSAESGRPESPGPNRPRARQC